jgi:activator of 2-hydroxyglutaryl-CoA dehydratase
LINAVEQELHIQLLVPPQPQIIGALGAAIIARTSNM